MLTCLGLDVALLVAEPGVYSPALRHVNCVAFQPGHDAVTAPLTCRRHGWRYDDGLSYRLWRGDVRRMQDRWSQWSARQSSP